MQTEYRPEIDGLRAVAVLAVVVFHAFPGALPGGFVGVDVFFVISGYIITRLLAAERQMNGRIDLVAFYARRIRRIFPALTIVVICTVVAAVFLLPDADTVARSAAASLLFVGNMYFRATTGGYFDPSAERMPLLHLWSLGVEEQFYLLWPLAMAFVLRRRPGALFKALAVAGLLSFAAAAVVGAYDPNAAFYLMPTRLWELAVGALIALCAPAETRHGPRIASLGFALILLPVATAPGFPMGHVVPAVVGAGMLLYVVHGRGDLGPVGSALRSRPAVDIGLISYSLYLWHWPLLAFANALHPGGAPAAVRLGICIAALALAWASFRAIETPLRRPRAATPNKRLVLAGALSTAALAYLSVVVASELPGPQGPAANPLIAATAHDHPSNRAACHYNFKSTFEGFPHRECVYNPAAAGAGRVVIWGDSRAYAWQPLARMMADRMDVPAVNFTRDSCAPALGYDNNVLPGEASKCREFNALAAEHLERADTVILAAAWPSDVRERDFGLKFEATLGQVSARVKRVILLGPTPMLRDTVPRCIAADALDACAITRAQFAAQAADVGRALAQAAARFKNVEFVDPTPFFCTADQCPAMKDGYGLYWDAHHISSSAARAFALEYLAP
jgi:peptidoglycan/LPS O-acetylase OafA/YrhL